MIRHSIKALGWFSAAALPLLSTPAWASPAPAGMEIASLGLTGQQIPNGELRNIRGGFSLGNNLSINFAFKQIEAVNGIIVKSIMIPQTNVTAAAASSSSSPLVTIPSSAPSVVVTDSTGASKTITPSSGSAVNLATRANNGLTVINTQLGSNGISNLTTNQANNTAISVAATMDIAITGMSQFLTQQQSFANVQSGMYYTSSAFK